MNRGWRCHLNEELFVEQDIFKLIENILQGKTWILTFERNWNSRQQILKRKFPNAVLFQLFISVNL